MFHWLIWILNEQTGEEKYFVSNAPESVSVALLIRVGRFCPAGIRGGGINRTIPEKHHPSGLFGLLDRATRQAGPGGIFPLADTLHCVSAWSFKAMILLWFKLNKASTRAILITESDKAKT